MAQQWKRHNVGTAYAEHGLNMAKPWKRHNAGAAYAEQEPWKRYKHHSQAMKTPQRRRSLR